MTSSPGVALRENGARELGPSAEQAKFPLGGIGAGNVSLGARGDLRDWQLQNRPAEGKQYPFAFIALHCSAGTDKQVRVVEAEPEPPYHAFRGLPPTRAAGLPRMDSSVFTGTYPIARIDFEDASLPVEVSLEAYTPCIPLAPDDSGLPVAVLTYEVTNPTRETATVSLLGSIPNPVGGLPDGEPKVTGDGLGGNVNAFRKTDDLAGLYCTSERYGASDIAHGTAALALRETGGVFSRPSWGVEDHLGRHAFHEVWNQFTEGGTVTGSDSDPTDESWTDVGSVGRRFEVAPGETVATTFLLAWHFPNRPYSWDQDADGCCVGNRCDPDGVARNRYAARFDDAWDVAASVHEEFDRLRQRTVEFRDALFGSTLPAEVIDAASATMAALRSPTCMWFEDGSFFGYEGCQPDHGCCSGTCTHVWNYAHTAAHLFPSLERNMRRIDFVNSTTPEGKMAFRTPLPLVENPDADALADHGDAADGQFGTVLRLYREYRHSGDRELVADVWPKVKASLDYALQNWDSDGDGVMEGVQHNTYDIEFHGANAMCGTWYLGALAAGVKLAEAVGDEEAADRFGTRLETGRERLDDRCWNGEYFEQGVEDANTERFQFGSGCLSDQVIGQWYADLLELGDLLPSTHVESALDAVYEHNFRDTVGDGHTGRVYAVDGEEGLVLCSWPRGGRPEMPFHFADEVWTGIEYQVASHLIERDRVDRGLDLVGAVRSRHDGHNRDPWNEPECGNYYARSMASWAAYQSLCGMTIDLPNRTANPAVDDTLGVGIDPAVDTDPFRCFWATDEAWGVYERDDGEDRFDIRYTA